MVSQSELDPDRAAAGGGDDAALRQREAARVPGSSSGSVAFILVLPGVVLGADASLPLHPARTVGARPSSAQRRRRCRGRASSCASAVQDLVDDRGDHSWMIRLLLLGERPEAAPVAAQLALAQRVQMPRSATMVGSAWRARVVPGEQHRSSSTIASASTASRRRLRARFHHLLAGRRRCRDRDCRVDRDRDHVAWHRDVDDEDRPARSAASGARRRRARR